MYRLMTYRQFVLNEGGKAIDHADSVEQKDVPSILKMVQSEFASAQSMKSDVTGEIFKIGSAGLKKDGETSGDIDMCWIVQGDKKDRLEKLKSAMEKLGHVTHYMPGLEILSVGFDFGGKTVQVDFIACSDKGWAKFIYHSPDFRRNESRYKSAHRNWLFSAILSQLVTDVEKDQDGEMAEWTGYVLRLGEGLFRVRKTKRSKKDENELNKHSRNESEEFVTMDPGVFVKFLFGEEYSEKDVKTFEDCLNIIKKPDYKYAKFVPEILKKYKEFIERVELPIPSEINN